MNILNTPSLHASCQHVVNWGYVAVMKVQAGNRAVANEVPPLELISMDTPLLNHRMLLVHRDLTGLVDGAPNSMNHVALSMSAFTT